jgi:sirohydrochlorin ferrochelatase
MSDPSPGGTAVGFTPGGQPKRSFQPIELMFDELSNSLVGRRSAAEEDRILVARLYGAAGRHASLGVPEETAVAELRGITTRPDLLGSAAGMFSASQDSWPEWNSQAARLLLAAGADPEVLAATAAEVAERLARRPISY